MKKTIKIRLHNSGPGGWYYFVIVGRNGKTVAQSETYERRASALKTINMLVGDMKDAVLVDETVEIVKTRRKR